MDVQYASDVIERVIFPFLFLGTPSISSNLRLVFLVVKDGCEELSQLCASLFVPGKGVQGNLSSLRQCASFPSGGWSQCGFPSAPRADNSLQGNACIDRLSNQQWLLTWKMGLASAGRQGFGRKSGWPNKFWFSFLVWKEGRRLRWGKKKTEVRRENGCSYTIQHSRYSLKLFPC